MLLYRLCPVLGQGVQALQIKQPKLGPLHLVGDLPDHLSELCLGVVQLLEGFSRRTAGWLVPNLSQDNRVSHSFPVLCNIDQMLNVFRLDLVLILSYLEAGLFVVHCGDQSGFLNHRLDLLGSVGLRFAETLDIIAGQLGNPLLCLHDAVALLPQAVSGSAGV